MTDYKRLPPDLIDAYVEMLIAQGYINPFELDPTKLMHIAGDLHNHFIGMTREHPSRNSQS